jgi:hypothetical protein
MVNHCLYLIPMVDEIRVPMSSKNGSKVLCKRLFDSTWKKHEHNDRGDIIQGIDKCIEVINQ